MLVIEPGRPRGCFTWERKQSVALVHVPPDTRIILLVAHPLHACLEFLFVVKVLRLCSNCFSPPLKVVFQEA